MSPTEYEQLVEILDRRFTEIDGRFTEIDRRFDEVAHRFDRVDQQIEEGQRSLAALRRDILGHLVDHNIAELRTEMLAGFAEMHRRFDWIDQAHRECVEIGGRIEAMLVGEPRLDVR